jgi:hypothetical protein
MLAAVLVANVVVIPILFLAGSLSDAVSQAGAGRLVKSAAYSLLW